MIAVSYYSKRKLKGTCKYILLLAFLFAFSSQLVQAQNLTSQTRSLRDASLEKTTLSDIALSRMAATIALKRREKLDAEIVLKSPAQQPALNSVLPNAADVAYSNNYFDTQDGNDYSFPEDSHDFCRAYFGSAVANQDFYLNASLNPGESLVATLTWDNPADYDLYIFDLEGYPVGDTDPLADFDGSNGTDIQTDTSPIGSLLEEASIIHNRPTADADEFVVVVDRFRGSAANTLVLTVSGDDDAFVVLEYVLGDDFSYVNAVTDEVVGPLTEGAVINLDALGSPRPNFNVLLNTDGCAESIVFTLVNNDTGETVEFTDNDFPYALFGDNNGDFNAGDLEDGNYTLTATPFSQEDGQGASADAQIVTFEIVSDNPPSVENFSLIDAASDEPIEGFNPIADGSVVDLVALFNLGIDINRLNIQANVSDPGGQIEQVDLDLVITLLTGEVQNVNNSDNGADYSVYGDDNAGDFSDAMLPVGDYALTGTPQAGGIVLGSTAVAFTVIGPRIVSYTLINADTELPVDGSGGVPDFDPIPEGAIIDMSTIGTSNINIRANTVDYTPPVIESVFFDMQSASAIIQNRVESFRPYSVFGDPSNMDLESGDANLDYNAWPAVQNGSFSLSGQPFGENGGVGALYGALTLNFSITNAAAGVAETAFEEPTLLPNYPNPFNPVTAIRFSLPAEAAVRLEVFDMLGRVVNVLVEGTLKSGFHEITFAAGNLPSGLYLYRLETPGAVKIRPMTLLK